MRIAAIAVLACGLLAGQSAVASDVVLPFGGRHYFTPQNEACHADTLCPVLHRAMDGCKPVGTPKACADFLDAVRELLPKHDCKRPSDSEAVPGLWLCKRANAADGADSLTEAFYLLRGLTYAEARTLYNSKEFGEMLKGNSALSDEYHQVKDKK